MKAQATAKFVGTSSRKIGLMAALIRGRTAPQAQTILEQAGQRATGPVGKVLAAALANAQHNANLKKPDLIVEAVLVGPGPTLKRFRPRARGAASTIRRRSSHITVILTDENPKSETRNPKQISNLETRNSDLETKIDEKSAGTAKKRTTKTKKETN